MQRFNFTIGYRPGSKNSAADALSRREELNPTESPKKQILFPEEQFIKLDEMDQDGPIAYALDAMVTDMTIRDMVKEYLRDKPEESPETEEWEDDLPFHQGRLWIPDDSKIKIKVLQLYHDSSIAGHQGITGTMELVTRGYYWPRMDEFMEEYVKGCRICQMAKKKNIRAHGKLQPLPVPDGPWQWTESDLIAPLPPSRGKNAIYVVGGYFL